MRTKIRMSEQALIDANIAWDMHRIVDLQDPVDDQDAVTKIYVDSMLGSGTGTIAIGPAEDSSYTDGLFTDFVPTTPVGTAVDRFNEVLKSLSPSPAPALSSTSCTTTGVSGKLSFGASNVVAGYTNVPALDINGLYTTSTARKGIFNASTLITGVLANNVTPGYANNRPYPNLSFGDAASGNLILEVNGSVLHTVDLSTFSSGNSFSAQGSGFTLTAATPVAFSNGDLFPVFVYRTGTWRVATGDQRLGYNTARVRHEFAPGQFRDCPAFDWVVDGDTNATSFSAETITNLSMTGARKISGVSYHTAGTIEYNLTASNVYRNTYSSSASAINFNGTNLTITDDSLSSVVSNTAQLVVSSKPATINSTRLLNGSVSVSTTIDRTVQSDLTSTGASIGGILLDSVADTSSISSITFNGETRRIHSGLSLTNTSYGTGVGGTQPAAWDSTISLVGGDSNYNSGLLVYNGALRYPSINFSTLASNGPAGNVNYSGASGNRTFIGYFYAASSYSNFRFNVTATGTSFVEVATGPSGNNLTFEVLAPNTTVNAGGTVEWKDAVKPKTADTQLGCYASTYGNVIPTNWGCSIGAKNTSTSGNVILIRITAASSWTGSISNVSIIWL